MNTHLIVHKKLQEQSTKGIINCVKNIYFKKGEKILNCDETNPRDVYRELFERLISPIYIPLLILISSMNILFSKENTKYLKYRFIIFLIGFLTIVISESSMGYIDKVFSKNLILISLPVISILTIYLSVVYKLKINKVSI